MTVIMHGEKPKFSPHCCLKNTKY